jgi:putative hydrolase of the HAD superfamily
VIRGVLFDLDNTLTDFMRMKRLASMEAARAMAAAGADFGTDPETAGQDLFTHYLEHGIESDDAFLRFLEKRNTSTLAWGQSRRDRILAAGIEAYMQAKAVFLQPYPGVRRTLVELTRRQVRLGVLTDAPRLKAWQRLTHLGLAEFFDVVVTSDDTGLQKPHPVPFKTAVEALGLKPYEVLMVGDWAAKDIVGAREYGLKTALAVYGAHDPDGPTLEPDFMVHEVGDVLKFLEELARA